jgi:hypothetical protein
MSFNGNQYPNFADKVISTRGDIIRGNSSGERARYGIGAANTVLTSDGTDPAWAAHGGVPTTTKGDISGYSTTQARIPISTNNFSLYGDSSAALGLKWAASPTSTLTTTGDLLAASAANVLTRIAGGASGEILTGNGAGVLPTFQAAAGGGGAYTFLQKETLGADTNSWTVTLDTAYQVASNGSLVIQLESSQTGGTPSTLTFDYNNFGGQYYIVWINQAGATQTTGLNNNQTSIPLLIDVGDIHKINAQLEFYNNPTTENTNYTRNFNFSAYNTSASAWRFGRSHREDTTPFTTEITEVNFSLDNGDLIADSIINIYVVTNS